MFSKEWKLAALSILAAVTLTACPKNKKKTEPESAFKGYWINAEAYERLAPIGGNPDPAICAAINAHPHRLGISRTWDQQLVLDAWIVYANGNTYRYTPTVVAGDAKYRERYYVGTISNGQLVTKSTIVPTYGGAPRGAVYYGGPFGRSVQGTTVRLNGNQMIVFAPGYGRYSVESYVRVKPDQLSQMSQLVAFCSDAIRFDVVAVPVPYGRAVPVPAPGAPVPAPGMPAPGADPGMAQQQPYMGQDGQYMDQQDPYMGQPGYDQQQPQSGKGKSGKGKQQLPPALEGQGQQGPAVPQQQQFGPPGYGA